MTLLVMNLAEQLGSVWANNAKMQQMARTMENKIEESKVRKTLSNGKETGIEKWILQHDYVL